MELTYIVFVIITQILIVPLVLVMVWAIYYDFSKSEIPPGVDQPLKLRFLHWLMIISSYLVSLTEFQPTFPLYSLEYGRRKQASMSWTLRLIVINNISTCLEQRKATVLFSEEYAIVNACDSSANMEKKIFSSAKYLLLFIHFLTYSTPCASTLFFIYFLLCSFLTWGSVADKRKFPFFILSFVYEHF